MAAGRAACRIWIRDGSFSIQALLGLGHTEAGDRSERGRRCRERGAGAGLLFPRPSRFPDDVSRCGGHRAPHVPKLWW
jgi:hypothetical protein